MTDHLQTPDEWLLQMYDLNIARPQNHVRPIIQLVDDHPPGSSEEYPRWSGQASWPDPPSYADLDRLTAQATRMREMSAQLIARRTA